MGRRQIKMNSGKDIGFFKIIDSRKIYDRYRIILHTV